MESILYLDFETRSAADLKKVGGYAYAEHHTTEVLCMAWKLEDGPVWTWREGIAFPIWVVEHIKSGKKIVGHNIPFDRAIWNTVLRRKYPELPLISIEQCDDTMSRAQAISLPAGLAKLGEVLQIPMPKDLEGHNLMVRLCKPRKILPEGEIVWWGTIDEFDRLGDYCARDVEATVAIHAKLPSLSDMERQLYILDQNINARGVCIDRTFAARAYMAAEEAKSRADRRIYAITSGAITKTTQGKRIVEWLNSRCIPCESIAKGETEELILKAYIVGDDVAEEVINLRRAAAKTSTAKFKAMCDCANSDNRVRGSLAYYGAYTGRWAGRNVQFQNFPRVYEEDEADVQFTLQMLEQDQHPSTVVDMLDIVTGKPMEVLSKCLRTMIVPANGKKLVGGDFKNIESRIAAWLAGDLIKVQAFVNFDAGAGPDIYLVTASKVLSKDVSTVTKTERQLYGKVPELACGYQGAVNAFHRMAAANNVNISDEDALRIVRAWREEHPAFVAAWSELQEAAMNAVQNPGVLVKALDDRIRFRVIGGILYMKLPSGRTISYPAPKLSWEPQTDHDTGEIIRREDGSPIMRLELSHMGVGDNKQWLRQKLYGGLIFANAVSGTARDILAAAMLRVDPDYPLVLTVHDELLSEVNDSELFTKREYKGLMEIRPDWARDIPITADTWEGYRYAK